jgi:hypothetical protein
MTDIPPDDVSSELQAMRVAHGALVELSEPARWRAVAWLVDVFQVPLSGDPARPEPSMAVEEAAVMRQAMQWAAGVVEGLDPSEVERAALEAQGWGDEQPLVARVLPLIASRLRIIAGAATEDEVGALWPST